MGPGVASGGECRHAVGKSREPRFSRLGAEPRPPKAKDANWRRSGDYGNETPDLEPRPTANAPQPPVPYSIERPRSSRSPKLRIRPWTVGVQVGGPVSASAHPAHRQCCRQSRRPRARASSGDPSSLYLLRGRGAIGTRNLGNTCTVPQAVGSTREKSLHAPEKMPAGQRRTSGIRKYCTRVLETRYSYPK